MARSTELGVGAALLLAACTGAIGGSQSDPADLPAVPGPFTPGGGGPAVERAGPMEARRLSRVEWWSSVRDLLGIEARPLLPDENTGSSGFATPGLVSEVDVQTYAQAAAEVAAKADLRSLAGCTTEDAECAAVFVRTFGRKAFRRPLAAEEALELRGLYERLRTPEIAFDHTTALRTVLEAILQHPAFLYHWEAVDPPVREDGLVKLGSHEIAARLSYFLWSSIPDDALARAADDGALGTVEAIEIHARRMLRDPKAKETIDAFVSQWLRLDPLEGAKRDPNRYPGFDAALATSMRDEVLAFARGVILDGDGRLETLLRGSFGFPDARLAEIYGVAQSGRVDLPPRQRPGILTRAGVLAATSNNYEGDPTKRGVLVRTRVLCQELAPPPADIPPLPPTRDDATVRERHEEHVRNAACAGCHALTDPIGYGFGTFDAVGRWTEREAGKTIDTSGRVAALDGRDRSFADVAGLTAILAESPEVRSCLVRQFARFALGRREGDDDLGALNRAYATFAASGFDLRELLVAIATSKTFRYRADR
jgi:hypothetical protein